MACALILCGSTFAQSHYFLKSKGIVGTTTGTNYDYKKAVRGGGTTSIMALPADQTFSAAQTLPFAFSFFGTAVTQYKVSDNGFLTFDMLETNNPTAPTTLPNASAPKNSIFAFWYNFKLASGSGVVDQIFSFTYGTTPNRVHVVQWLSCTNAGATAGLASFAIRFYEGKNTFDVVHNQASAAISGTVGVNNADGTVGIASTNAPSTAFDATSADDDYATMGVWTFKPGPQPANEIELTSISISKYTMKNNPMAISGVVTNYGADALTGFKLSYSVDNGTPVVMTLSGLNIGASGGTYGFTHNSPYIPSTAANSSVKVWIEAPNGGVDADVTNNEMSKNFYVLNATVPRMVLHEIFTSSTCPPCKPGNENLKNVLNAKIGSWNLIKYQVNFPGNGDPYYTLENGARFNYYGASFAPWLTVDGDNNWNDDKSQGANANYYTESDVDAKSGMGAFATIAGTFTQAGNKITVSGTVTPVQTMPQANLKLRIAIVERTTKKNLTTNGETEFNFVSKKMLPDAAGTTISFSAGTPAQFSQTFTFPGKYRLPINGLDANIINLSTENSVEEMGNLFAVIFVQDDDDKLIWQSFSTDAHQWALSVNEVTDLGLNIYPNPAATSFNVTFTGASNHGVVRILDINGKEVITQTISDLNGSINCDNLATGLYVVELNVAGKTAVKKMNIIR